MTSKLFLTGVVAAVVIALCAVFYSMSQPAVGSGYIGWPVHLQLATTTTVGPDTVAELFADAADCKSRVITTNNSAIWMSFDDYNASTTGSEWTFGSTTIGVNVGHYQAASTTVAYESGIYGCGKLTAYSSATGTVTVSNF